MQTDDTLMLRTTKFLLLEEKKLKKAQFQLKLKATLLLEVQLEFNGCTLTIDASELVVYLRQKGQGGKIKLVNTRSPNRAQQYMEQRARGAYIALTC